MNTHLQYDDAIDRLYVRHDGGQDTRKGVQRAADYTDFSTIPDPDAASLLVYLDIFRGVPQGNDLFYFGPDDLIAKSAFVRMFERTRGTARSEVMKIERSSCGISYGDALSMVNSALGSAQLDPACPAACPLTRQLAVSMLSDALHTAAGDGDIPFLFYVPETCRLKELLLPEHTVAASPDGTLITLTVNGEFQPLVGGYLYQGDIQLSLTERYELYRYTTEPQKPGAMPDEPSDLPPEPAWWNYFEEPYRAALFFSDGEKIPARSVDAACRQTETGGLLLTSSDAPSNAFAANNFNGIIAGGKTGNYTFRDIRIRFNGNGMDDFQGMGAGLLFCGDDTEILVENADICNYGTVRSTMVVGGSAKVLVKDSRFQAHDGQFESGWVGGMGAPKMRSAPIWGGFEGNCRCTNLLDKAEANYFQSQILSEKWGVLSTDNNKGCHSTAINSLIAITGGLNDAVDITSEQSARESIKNIPFSEIYGTIQRDLGNHPYASHSHPGGYGTYSIGNTTVKFAGSTVITADYANTCVNAAAKVVYCSSSPENLAGVFGADTLDITPQNTVVYCDKVGVMMQRGNGNGGVTIRDNTVFHCGQSCFSVKSNGSFHIDVDHSQLLSESGTILQLMDDDDLPGDIADPPSPDASARKAASDLVSKGLLNRTSALPGRDVFAHFSNMEICGNCYNASGYRGAVTEEDFAVKPEDSPFNPFHQKPIDAVRNLELLLDNVQYSGIISTAEGHHIDRDTGRWLSPVPHEKWYCLAMLENIPTPPYQAGLILKMENNSVWNVTQTSYLTSLVIDSSSSVKGTVYVNGSLTNITPDTLYSGTIIVQPGCLT